MGAITVNSGALTGSITVANSKVTNVLRLYGQATIEGFDGLSNQQKADAVAAELYRHAREVAWAQRQAELRATRTAEDSAAKDEL